MILRTTTPQEFRDARATLTSAGYTELPNFITPQQKEGTNFIVIDHKCALFALTSQARADKDGYCNYSDSQFIKNLKK